MATRDNPFQYIQRWPELAKLFDPPLSMELVALLEQRDRDLEDVLNQQPIIFDHDAGAPSRSKVWTAKGYTKIRRWSIELTQDDAGDDVVLGADFTLQLHIDGVSSSSLVLPAGDVYVEYSGPLPSLEAGNRLTLYATDSTFDFVSTVWL